MPELPQSDALREAGSGADSLTELMSRDPAGLSSQDLDRLIDIMRGQRENWAKMEATGGRQKKPAVPTASAEELGL